MKAVISKLFSKKQLLTPFIPENTRVYCIGDIHGSYELLLNLFEKIENDYHHFNGKIIIIYLGDFIDRGNKSQEVINFILAHKNPSIEYVYLRGNHEQTLLDFLHDERIARTWLTYGGQATLISYNEFSFCI